MDTATQERDVVLKVAEVRTWQRLKGWSDYKLAREMGISGSYLSRIISGNRKPGAKFIARLLDLTQCPFETFFEARK